eukprot:XP_001706320.1 Hypothetical protein GL50803_36168 [Giardia lamblia ATCC 50803]
MPCDEDTLAWAHAHWDRAEGRHAQRICVESVQKGSDREIGLSDPKGMRQKVLGGKIVVQKRPMEVGKCRPHCIVKLRKRGFVEGKELVAMLSIGAKPFHP